MRGKNRAHSLNEDLFIVNTDEIAYKIRFTQVVYVEEKDFRIIRDYRTIEMIDSSALVDVIRGAGIKIAFTLRFRRYSACPCISLAG